MHLLHNSCMEDVQMRDLKTIRLDKKQKCADVFQDYNVNYCYLFGSYAKGKAGKSSDVDLLISSDTKGLKFYEMVERLRGVLHKKVDALDHKQLLKNEALLNDVLKDGVKIYR